MMRTFISVIVVALLLPCGVATAQKLYKWVDPDGNVSYHDRQPPDGSDYKVEEKDLGSKGGDGAAYGDPTQKFPVVLYSVPKCSSCDAARAYLQNKKVPFTEKSVESDPKVQKELKDKSGGLSVPTILVGPNVMNGYLESLLEGELKQAGYFKPGAVSNASTEKKSDDDDDSDYAAPTE